MDQQKTSFPATLPKKMAKLLQQNHTLKLLTIGAYIVCFFALVVASVSSHRKPIVVPIDSTGSKVTLFDSSKWTTDMIEEAVREYLIYRYNWNPQNQLQQLTKAKTFVAEQSQGAFNKVITELIKFSKDKAISQRAYPTEIKIDTEKNTATLTADRFDEIQGLKAASTLNLKLFFERGSPQLENPWGFYVTKEEESVGH